jgi:GAF domain-containing protein
MAQLGPVVAAVEEDQPDGQALLAPVMISNKPVGALQLYRQDGQPWTDQELALVETMLNQVAQTAENLRLFDEAQEQASFETLVGDISEKLRQAPTLDILARTVAEELGKALGVSHSLVQVGAGVTLARDQNGKQE